MPVTPSFSNRGAVAVAQWVSESGNGVAAPSMVEWPRKTIQSTGTGTVTVEGSSDGTNWDSCTTTPTPVTAGTTIAVINENPYFIRAVCAGGTQTVTITGTK